MEAYKKEEIQKDMHALKELITAGIKQFAQKYNGKVIPDVVVFKTQTRSETAGAALGEETIEYNVKVSAQIIP